MKRHCPICETELVEKNLHRQMVDRCEKCNGIYFDKGELESILTIVNIFNSVILDEEEIESLSEAETDRKLKCPEDGTIMDKKELGPQVVMDVCSECEGIWLDNREISALKTIQNHVKEYLNLYIRLGS